MIIQIILILIMILGSMLLIESLIEVSAKLEEFQLKKGDQLYDLNSVTPICGKHESQNYTLWHEIVNFQSRGWENSSAIFNMDLSLNVYDSNNRLLAKSKQTHVELVTEEGLPINRKVNFYLSCINNTNTSLSFPIKETINIDKDGLYFSDPIVSYYTETVVYDPDLKAELVAQDLDYPTTMAFLSINDILVLEKDKGTVERIVNGQTLEKPLLDINVSGYGEDGLVGIAVMTDPHINKTYVYLYYTETTNGDVNAKNKPEGNRLYRYEFVNDQLINPKLILDLPHGTSGIHNGGKILVGPDNNVYVTVGDTGRGHWDPDIDDQAQNNKTGQKPDGTGGILRVTPDGTSVGRGILGSFFPLNLYYAYGIRNSFGIDFDPVTGNLWDTENGDVNGDEINLVEPGFNSGWSILEGMSKMQQELNLSSLVDFNLKGKYSDPEFNWYAINKTAAVGPTALKFIDSSKYGKKYENDMLMGDFNYGRLYHFDLSKDRTKLSLTGDLKDKMTDGDDENFDIILAQAPGGVIDVQLGPDGYIYFVSLNVNVSDCDVEEDGCLVHGGIKGAIFRIVPKN
jgi:aldose sugar dehydrogenase